MKIDLTAIYEDVGDSSFYSEDYVSSSLDNIFIAIISSCSSLFGAMNLSSYFSGSETIPVSTTIEGATFSSKAGMIPGLLLIAPTASSGIKSSSSIEQPIEGIPLWKDSSGGWHIGNTIPYSLVEHRATKIYNMLHNNIESSLPFIVASSSKISSVADQLFSKHSVGFIEKELEILENALSRSRDD